MLLTNSVKGTVDGSSLTYPKRIMSRAENHRLRENLIAAFAIFDVLIFTNRNRTGKKLPCKVHPILACMSMYPN